MVIPVGESGNQEFLQIDKTSETEFKQKKIFSVAYVPLTSKEQQLRHD